MPTNEQIQRVRIYLSERDMVEGQPLYLAALEQLRREGATGATALRGIAGFGAGHRQRTAGLADLGQSPPIVIEWVDRPERVMRVLPALDALLPNALITIEDIQVYRAALRSSGPFGERTVGEVLARDLATATRQMPLRGAALLMIERRQTVLPVLDEQEGIAGALAAADFTRRAGLALPLPLIGTLTPEERMLLLADLPEHTLADLPGDQRTLYVEAPIPHAVNTLVEWGLDALPVADRDGRFAGLFGVEQALRAALEAAIPSEGRVRNADPPTPVSLVMQRAIPTIAANAPLSTVLAQLSTAAERFLVVTDGWRPVGTLADVDLAERLQGPQRAAWLESIQSPGTLAPDASVADPDGMTAVALASTPAPLISTTANQNDAIQQMLDQSIERLVVVDEEGRVAGLLARRILLRALAQASTN